jgi:hypothetical protein
MVERGRDASSGRLTTAAPISAGANEKVLVRLEPGWMLAFSPWGQNHIIYAE